MRFGWRVRRLKNIETPGTGLRHALSGRCLDLFIYLRAPAIAPCHLWPAMSEMRRNLRAPSPSRTRQTPPERITNPVYVPWQKSSFRIRDYSSKRLKFPEGSCLSCCRSFFPFCLQGLPFKDPIDCQYEMRIYWRPIGEIMDQRTDVFQGTLGLMILKTLDAMGSLHGYGIARRIEQISGDRLSINYGTIYPALLKLEQEGCISSEWGVSDNNRKAKYYKITRSGRKQLLESKQGWEQTKAILDRFLALGEES